MTKGETSSATQIHGARGFRLNLSATVLACYASSRLTLRPPNLRVASLPSLKPSEANLLGLNTEIRFWVSSRYREAGFWPTVVWRIIFFPFVFSFSPTYKPEGRSVPTGPPCFAQPIREESSSSLANQNVGNHLTALNLQQGGERLKGLLRPAAPRSRGQSRYRTVTGLMNGRQTVTKMIHVRLKWFI